MKIRSFGSRLFFIYLVEKKMARLETEGENSQEPFWCFVDCFYKCDLSQIPSKIIEYQRLFGCFFFCHSIFVTHHSKIPCLFGTITHFPSLNIFHTICGPHTCHSMQLFLFLFFLQYPN